MLGDLMRRSDSTQFFIFPLDTAATHPAPIRPLGTFPEGKESLHDIVSIASLGQRHRFIGRRVRRQQGMAFALLMLVLLVVLCGLLLGAAASGQYGSGSNGIDRQ